MSGCHQPINTLPLCEHGQPVKFPCLLCAPTHSEISLIDLVNAINQLSNRVEALHEFKLHQCDENKEIKKRLNDLGCNFAKRINEHIDRLEKIESEIKGHQKQINDVIGLFTKDDLKLENELDAIQYEAISRLEKLESFHKEWRAMPKYDLKECIDLVNAHEEYLKKISDIALCDPEKVIANLKILQDRMEQLENLNQQCFDANPLKMIEEKITELQTQIDIIRALESRPFIKDKKPHECPCCAGWGKRCISTKEGIVDCHSCSGKGIIWG